MIKYGICVSSVIPIRREANDRSEMISQMLFGETFQVLEETIKWTFVKNTFDGYTGWVDNKEITFLSEDNYNDINKNSFLITNKLFTQIKNQRNEILILPAGSTLPNFNQETRKFNILNNQYELLEEYSSDIDIDHVCRQFLNAPYLWGGKNPFGIDCSGFIQVITKIFGKQIPRDANQQVNSGENINFISDAVPGDFAFFDDQEGNIIHVGIILKNNEIIHASGKVRIDKIDQQGINNLDLKKYTHKLRVIKRVLN
jgi:hypothetical protein